MGELAPIGRVNCYFGLATFNEKIDQIAVNVCSTKISILSVFIQCSLNSTSEVNVKFPPQLLVFERHNTSH